MAEQTPSSVFHQLDKEKFPGKCYATIEEIRKDFGALYHNCSLEVRLVASTPDRLLVVVKDSQNPDIPRGPLPICLLFDRVALVAFARSVLGIEPPVEEKILREIQEIRKNLPAS